MCFIDSRWSLLFCSVIMLLSSHHSSHLHIPSVPVRRQHEYEIWLQLMNTMLTSRHFQTSELQMKSLFYDLYDEKQTKHKSKAAAMLWDWLYWQLKWEKVDARKRSASICHHIQMSCNSCIYARTSPKCLHHHLHTFVFELQSKLRARHLHSHYTRYSLIWKLLDQEQSILSSCRMFQMLVWNTRKQTDSHFSVNGI